MIKVAVAVLAVTNLVSAIIVAVVAMSKRHKPDKVECSMCKHCRADRGKGGAVTYRYVVDYQCPLGQHDNDPKVCRAFANRNMFTWEETHES